MIPEMEDVDMWMPCPECGGEVHFGIRSEKVIDLEVKQEVPYVRFHLLGKHICPSWEDTDNPVRTE